MKVGLQLYSNDFWVKVSKHIFAWILYISYELIYLYMMNGKITNPGSYILNYSLNISLFYFNAYVLLNYIDNKFNGSTIAGLLAIIIQIAIFLAIKYPINLLYLGENFASQTTESIRMYLVSNTLRSFYFVGFSTAYWFALQTNKRNRKISELETQKLIQQNEKITLQKDLLQSRNAYLQAQVNPHLLFNTLNFMYNTSAKVSEKLAETVMNLSDMMRYALTSIDEDDKVTLEKEIKHIHNYIRLNQARFNENLNVDILVNGDSEGLRIIPLALITLVENVFQYGDLQDPQHPAHIRINIQDGRLELELKNKKRANRRTHGHGTGIRNLRERLNTYYPGLYSFNIQDEESSYALTLTLTLNE